VRFSSKLMIAGAVTSLGGLALAGAPVHNLSAFGFFLGGLVIIVGAARVIDIGPSSRGATSAVVAALICGFGAFGVTRTLPTYLAATALAAAFLLCAIGIAFVKPLAAWIASGIVLMLVIAGLWLFPVKDILPVVAMIAVPITIFFVEALRA